MTSVVEKSGVEKIVFPKNLGESGIYPFMHIRINERQGQEKEGYVTSIFTYIPVGIFNNDGISYGNLEQGLVGASINAVLGAARGNGIVLTQEDLMAAAGAGAGAVQSFVGFDPTGGYNIGMTKKGVAANPAAVTAFESPEIRNFDINLKFITESAEESKEVGKIINRIQEFMYPEKIGQYALQYPATFEVEFYAPVNGEIKRTPYMPLYAPAYCTGLQTTYNPSHASFHPDGAPVEVDVQLSFKEKDMLVREDIKRMMNEAGITHSDAEDETGVTLTETELTELDSELANQQNDANIGQTP